MTKMKALIVGAVLLVGGGTAPVIPVVYQFNGAAQTPYYDTFDGYIHEADYTILENGVYVTCVLQCGVWPEYKVLTPQEATKYTFRPLVKYNFPVWYKDPATGDVATDTLADKVTFDSLSKKDAVLPTKTVNKSVAEIISQ